MNSKELKKTASDETLNNDVRSESQQEAVAPETGDTQKDVELHNPNDNFLSEQNESEAVSADAEDDDSDLFEGDDDGKEIPSFDYTGYNKVQLINTFRKLLAGATDDTVRHHIESIKTCFYKLHHAELKAMKEQFVAEGGKEEDFASEPDVYETDLKDLMREYRNLKTEFNRKQEAEKEQNYLKKLEVIEEIKALVNGEESINATFHEFHELQNRWKEIGMVPQGKVKDLWENYHHHVELFYDYIKINRELRDLDLKKNMKLKVNLCEKAELLAADESDSMHTFKELQKLHETWREVGPVPREHKQELWDRFKAATSIINKRYQQFFEGERQKQKENLTLKIALCEKAEEFAVFSSENPRDWNAMTEKILALQEEWKTIGFAPRKDNTKVWERFRAANDNFFQRKREFWAKSKQTLHDNLMQKIEICEKAESLKDNEDWKTTADKLIALQKKWKEVGPVPRKQSDVVWKRFRAACDDFFNRRENQQMGMSKEQENHFKAKKAMIAEVVRFQPVGDAAKDLAALDEFQNMWKAIGETPFRRKDDVEANFRNAVNAQLDKIDIDEQERNLHKFSGKVIYWTTVPRGWSKINTERDRCTNRLKQLESELVTLNNNIEFFGTSDGAQSLRDGVTHKMERIQSQIDYLKAKVKIIDTMD